MEIQILDKTFVPYISALEIEAVVKRVANELINDYQKEIPVFLVVLNGAFMFASDLMKCFTEAAEISFIKMASYEGVHSTGEVTQLLGLDIDITNRHVVIIEDIVDTGTTIAALHQLVNKFKIKSVKVATLFFKPEAYQQSIDINYKGFSIENKFIVGYGLDYNKQGRNLSEIYQVK